ncbi:MAG: hypothetical protein ACK5PP_18830 [Acidimicrobiales bacterium]
MSRRRMLLAVVAALGVVAVGRGWRWDPAEAPPVDVSTRPETLTVETEDTPPEIGSPLRLRVSGIEPADGTVTVDVIHQVATSRQHRIGRLVAVGGEALLEIPGEATRESGRHLIVVSTDDQWGQTTIPLAPGPAADGFVPLVGAQRIVADGASETMVTITASDRYGNAVAPGTPFGLVVRRPDGTVESSTGALGAAGVIGVRVRSTEQVGLAGIVVTVDGHSGAAAGFLQTPGAPASWRLEVPNDEIVADGRSTVDARATDVVDGFGNTVSDGTAIRAVVETASGRQIITGRVIDGTAELTIRAPTAPGTVTLSTPTDAADTVAPPPVTITATPGVATIAAEWVAGDDSVSVGPVRDPLGAYVADGTMVELYQGPLMIAQGRLRDGYVRLWPTAGTDARPEELTVRVLGVEGMVRG